MIERILRKITRWLGFTVFLSLTPIFWAWISARMHGLHFTFESFATNGEFFLLSVAISGDALGEIVGSNSDRRTIKTLLAAILTIVLSASAFSYVDMVASAKTGQAVVETVALSFSVFFLIPAVIVGLFGVAISED